MAAGMEQWNDGIVPVKSWNGHEPWGSGFVNSAVQSLFTKLSDCLPLAGTIFSSPIHGLRDFFRSTEIVPGKARNGSISGLQRYSQSHQPYGFPASTGTIPVEWKNVHRLWMGDLQVECSLETVLVVGSVTKTENVVRWNVVSYHRWQKNAFWNSPKSITSHVRLKEGVPPDRHVSWTRFVVWTASRLAPWWSHGRRSVLSLGLLRCTLVAECF